VKLLGKAMRKMARAVPSLGLLCGLTLGLSGCRHRMQIPTLPPIQAPVALEEIPPLENPPILEMPAVKLPPTPVAAAAASLRRERRRAVAKAAPAPATAPAVSAEPEQDQGSETAAIGALTAGGETNPQTKQDATELIASLERRINSLPTQTTEEQKAQISKVRNFWRDAQAALKSGDAEGAMTLAIKAKVLLDDMEK
jgi:hypothetical protein